ncbi:MAG: aminoacyl-tRNA hydrolase [Tissierellia bacterium]|nr:aminoacyl-tRNA hydrolase [Tissierellia bacterium]
MEMKLIVGLGNPGSEYRNTRHNVGFATMDAISDDWGIDICKGKWNGILGEGRCEGERVLLLKPLTYMNESGRSVKQVADFYKIDPEDILIILDDKDIKYGTIRVRKKGSAGSHNGMKSIIYQLGTDEIPRIKIAIGKPPAPMRLRDFVLAKIGSEDGKIIREEINWARDAARVFIRGNIDEAMNQFNGTDYFKGE